MKKRLLPILLTLVLVCALPLGAVFVTSGDVTSALVSAAWAEDAVGENSTEGEGSAPAQVTFTEVDSETTLKNAVAAGKSVKLTGDIGIKSTLEVKSSLTLDLNGRVLSRVNPSSALRADFSMIQVENGATLTLVDSGSAAVHKFNTSGQPWRKVSDDASGEDIATVYGGVIYGAVNSQIEDMSGIKIVSGTLEMRGGNIVGVASDWSPSYGGGVYVSDGCTFNMCGGSIKGCSANGGGSGAGGGGGVYVAAGGTFTMSGSSLIEGCKAGSGGGVYNKGEFTMSGSGCIKSCVYGYLGSAGVVENKGLFAMNGGSIEGSLRVSYSYGTENGVGIYNDATLNVNTTVGCEVSNAGTISSGKLVEFTEHVVNNSGGTISGGEFKNGVTNEWGKITNGEFTGGTVDNTGAITGGNFHVEVINRNGGRIGGGTFNKTVTNKDAGVIGNDQVGYNGVFKGNVTNSNYSTINGGTFYGNVTNSDNAILNGGTFYGTVTGSGTINAKAYETVTFDSAGGTAVASQTVLRGQKATKPAAPTKAGYTFGGWFVEGAATAFAFTNASITESMTLTAKWELCGHNASENRPTCTEGVKCSVCAADLPATGHSGGKATCAAKAKCSVCQAEYGDLEPNNHADLTHVDAAAATTKAEGNIEYWHCTGCGRYFSDEQATKEITQADTVLAKLPPRYYYNSGTAAKPDNGKKNSPGTADPGVMLYGAAVLLSLTGMAVLTGKKK